MLPSTSKLSESQRLRLQALGNLSETAKLAAYVGAPCRAANDNPSEKLGRSCAAGLSNVVAEVRIKRINAETYRRQLRQAQFINVPVLVMKDGTQRIPLKYQSKRK